MTKLSNPPFFTVGKNDMPAHAFVLTAEAADAARVDVLIGDGKIGIVPHGNWDAEFIVALRVLIETVTEGPGAVDAVMEAALDEINFQAIRKLFKRK